MLQSIVIERRPQKATYFNGNCSFLNYITSIAVQKTILNLFTLQKNSFDLKQIP